MLISQPAKRAARPVPTRIALLALLLILCGCASAPLPPAPETAGREWRSVQVVNHGLHAGLLIARTDLLRELPALAETFGDGDFVELGWGDEAFYRAPQATLGLALRALFRSSAAVLHVVKITGDPRRRFAGSEVVELRLSADGYRQLLAFVAASFSRPAPDALAELGPGLYGESRFYSAEGRYSLLRTCNTWLAEALAAGGCPLQPAAVLTAGQLMSRLRQMTPAGTVCRPGR